MKHMSTITGVILLCLLLISACSTYGVQHSILESTPYMDTGMHSAAAELDGHYGRGININVARVETDTDVDTTIEGYQGALSVRKRLSTIGDMGVTLTATHTGDDLYGYGIIDGKFHLLRQPVSIMPDIGIGAGRGSRAWMFDARTALIVSADLIRKILSLHFAPHFIGLVYPSSSDATNDASTSYGYAITPLYGINMGLTYSMPLAPTDMYIVPRLKIQPAVNVLFGHEPEGARVDLTMLQIGCSFIITY